MPHFHRITLLPLLLLAAACGSSRKAPARSADIGLIPAPVEFRAGRGICQAPEAVNETTISKEFEKALHGLPEFTLKEAYRLVIKRKGITLEAFTEEGLFRGRKTLQQLQALGEIPCGTILDYPRFRHRGLMIDESRSFKGLDFLKKQMDAMALLKLNVLHLHLDDSAGWRIESEAYPLLTEKTAWRKGVSYLEWEAKGYPFTTADDPEAYGGYYTREQLQELVAYAAERYITVIPEIEMPGHSMEVGYAYPEVTCQRDDGQHIPGTWELCPGQQATYDLLEAVLDEIMDIFPGEFIHIGGDEANIVNWQRCLACRRMMELEGMSDCRQLQGYLVRRIDAYVRSHGHRIIGWDEILETGVPAQAAIQSWRGLESGIRASQEGHDVVLSPTSHCYFDYYQDLIRKEPRAVGELISLRRCYSFEPLAEGMNPNHVLGIQANLWCEHISTAGHAEYMLYPRLFALAETAWSPAKRKDYVRFRPHARALLEVFKGLGYNSFDMDTESERAQSKAYEKSTRNGYNYVVQQDGPTLSYTWDSGVRIIVADEQAFRDMNGNGRLDPFEDWRLSPEKRMEDLLRQEGPVFGIDVSDPEVFREGKADNPMQVVANY